MWVAFAIQLAKHIGTTASAANHSYVRGPGADEVIDYNAQDFTKAASGCDAALDTVGADVAQRSFAVLKPGGRAAFIASGSQAPKAPRGDVQSLRPNVARDRSHLDRLVALFEAGALRVPEVTRFPVSEAATAHRVSQTRHFRGKLVLVVKPGPRFEVLRRRTGAEGAHDQRVSNIKFSFVAKVCRSRANSLESARRRRDKKKARHPSTTLTKRLN